MLLVAVLTKCNDDSRTGQLMLIYPSMRQQFVFEGLFVAFLSTFPKAFPLFNLLARHALIFAIVCLASVLWVALTVWVPEMPPSARQRGYLQYGVLMLVVLNMLFKIFSMKNYGYPYHFYLL